jgi:5-methylcytosine-specific restriction protein A
MATALFINGIYDTVLTEILAAQAAQGGGESFLQPYRRDVISMFRENPPSPNSPVPLYVSTTENLTKICYTAEIIKWEDKRELSESRRQIVMHYLETYQAKECDLFRGTELGDGKAVNLITIRNLRRLSIWPPTSLLIKKSNGLPLKERNRAGGWSEVYERGDLAVFTITSAETEESSTRKLAEEIQAARNLDANTLQQRLATAPKIPERIQIISVGYRRNADVIVSVLNRANGVCERCSKAAPFLRKSDGTPFLEVHHRKPLGDGGEDTTENALALCPNCHREVHHG